MELKVIYAGAERVVTGLTAQTTCQDIIYALAHASGHLGRFVLIEQSVATGGERSLAPNDRPFERLQHNNQTGDVRFVLRHLDGTASGSEPLLSSDSLSSTTSSNSQFQSPLDEQPANMFNAAAARLAPNTDLLKRLRSRSTSQQLDAAQSSSTISNGQSVDQNGLTRSQSRSASSIQSTSSGQPNAQPQPGYTAAVDQSLDTTLTSTSNVVQYNHSHMPYRHPQVNGLTVLHNGGGRHRTNSSTNSITSTSSAKPPPPSYEEVMQRRRHQQNGTPMGSICSVNTTSSTTTTSNGHHSQSHFPPSHNGKQYHNPNSHAHFPNSQQQQTPIQTYHWPAGKDDLLKMIHLQELRLQEQRQRLRALDEQHPHGESVSAQHRLLREQIAQHQAHRARLRREIDILNHRHAQQQHEQQQQQQQQSNGHPQQQQQQQQHRDIGALRAHLAAIDAQLSVKNREVAELTSELHQLTNNNNNQPNVDNLNLQTVDNLNSPTNKSPSYAAEIEAIEQAIVARREKLEHLMAAVATGGGPGGS